jgi:hypothetical protein
MRLAESIIIVDGVVQVRPGLPGFHPAEYEVTVNPL